ncbi:probable phosphatidylinositol 4-kinase beta [Coccomyxa sp. Obi]|nr:probable phosphatidylinositol 4-kinase beta [Coccomyxa sp. Obi]
MPILGINRRGGDAKQQGTSPSGLVPAGKTDLLLRFFDSAFFDEWIALTYLYKSNSPGVQDYLCNRLYSLPEAGLERYLSQLCQLIISRPYGPLEKVVVDLCARSLRFAVKTYWILLAISQDQPKNKYVSDLRDRCERAALEGSWEPPFRETKLLPLSPPRSRPWLRSSPISPSVSMQSQSGKLQYRGHAVERVNGNSNNRWGSPDPFLPGDRPSAWGPPGGAGALGRPMSPDIMNRPTSPDGLGGGLYSSYTMGTGLEGLICASPPAVRDHPPRRVPTLSDLALILKLIGPLN